MTTRRLFDTLEAVGLLLFFTLLAIFVSRVIWDIDIFWHIAAGRAIVDGGLPATDIFSAIDPDRPWATFQWGYEVLVYWLEAWGGLHLVRAGHALVMLAAFASLWIGLRRRLGIGALSTMLLMVLTLVLFEDRIRVRPHVFNLLGWTLLFPWLVRGPTGLGRRAVVTTALVVGIWANLHAGGAFLFLIAAAALPLGALTQRLITGTKDAATRRATIWYLAALTPALLSPGFIEGNLHALAMLSVTESAIEEWMPAWSFLSLAQASGHYVCGVVPLLVAALWIVISGHTVLGLRAGLQGLRARLTTTPAWALALGLALTVLSLRSVRFVYIAVFAYLSLRPALRQLPMAPALTPRARRYVSVIALVALSVSAWRFNVTLQHGDLPSAFEHALSSEPLDTRRFPVAHADFLTGHGFEGDIYAQGNWGGYLLYRLWPHARVTADGRGNYDAQVRDDLAYTYDRAHFNTPAQGEEVRAVYGRYPVDALVHQHPVWPRGYTPPASEWLPVFSNPQGAIWIRNTPDGQRFLDRLRTGPPDGSP